MRCKAALQKLQSIHQERLLASFENLTANDQNSLLDDIESLDTEIFKLQQTLILKEQDLPLKEEKIRAPQSSLISFDSTSDEGVKFLREGKAGCILVAGGQGSRLKFQGAKGCFLISPVKKKSLFQIFSEKVGAAGLLYGQNLEVAIMTSLQNEDQTKSHFSQNNYFGLEASQISFFSQNNLPLLDLEGNLILENECRIAKGPDGNGSALKAFVDSGIYENWKKKGILFVSFIQVDNPLADPFDPRMLNLHISKKADLVVKTVKRADPAEPVGILIECDERLHVVEYSEVKDSIRLKKTSKGALKYDLANISHFSFSMDFIHKMALNEKKMPLHKALKKRVFERVNSKVQEIWKFEKFIFDVLPFADHFQLLLADRRSSFSPLKNLEGYQSVITVQNEMQALDYKTMTQITGKESDYLKPFEIAREFYYPQESLLSKWKNKKIPLHHYIEP